MSTWEKIKQIFSDPRQVAFLATGVTLFAFYSLYARKQLFQQPKAPTKNSLDMSVSLMNEIKDTPNICKIVITQSSQASSQFKKRLVTRLKQFLINNSFNTLVNCAPLKLFHAGAQVFVGYLNQQNPDNEQEQQLMSYFENALKCHLIVQRTIIDIDQIKNKQKKCFLICDSNTLDIKVQNNKKLWDRFVQKSKINEKKLMENYNVVFHIQGNQNTIPEQLLGYKFKQFQINDPNKAKRQQIDQKIYETWKKFKEYHVIHYNPHLMLEENVQIAMESISISLRSYLPKDLMYTRRRVFTKDW